MTNVFDEFQQRGFIHQTSNDEALKKILNDKNITCYVGYDPTASSLHIGNLLSIMMLAHMQRYGHRPVAILGGGTAMIGDPSGKTETRKMLTREQIIANGDFFYKQFSSFINFEDDKAIMVDNFEWLGELKYIDFLREIGKHFSVNKMLTAEAYKIRLETGLSFLEFNYQLFQAYDFLMLYKKYGCVLQMGGSDQWGNIVAGIDLIRRAAKKEAFGLTAPLLTTAAGQKMGKTASGALWLDGNQTKPYDFYQYWINVDDRDVIRLLKFYTFLSLDEIARYSKLQGADLREAKKILAFEVTKLVHGLDEAQKAQTSTQALFVQSGDDANIPEVKLDSKNIGSGIGVMELFQMSGLTATKSDARRLIKQGGAYLNRERVASFEGQVTLDDFNDNILLLRAGKKKYRKIVLT